MSHQKHTGKCKWFNSKKGFGFITPDDGAEEIFVHQSSIHAQGFRSLAENEEVEFEIQTDENNRQKAINVTGPNGAFVKGAPAPAPRRYDDYDSGYSRGSGSGYGRSNYGSSGYGNDSGNSRSPRGGYRGGRGGFRSSRGAPRSNYGHADDNNNWRSRRSNQDE